MQCEAPHKFVRSIAAPYRQPDFMDIVLASYSIAAGGYLLLSVLVIPGLKSSPVGPTVLAAAFLTSLWAGTIAMGTFADYPPIVLMHLSEVLRNAAWLALLLQLNGLQSTGDRWDYAGWHWRKSGTIAFALSFLLFCLPALPIASLDRLADAIHEIGLALWLLMAIGGLVLVEQLYRNDTASNRWASKFLCLGIGGLFLYDFFMYAEALLFRQLDAELWRARGLVTTTIVPWLAIGITRQRESQLDLHVSRRIVFHSITLLGVGVYLLCMAAAGYYIKFWGGDWGSVLQVAFIGTASIILLSILFSGRLRANLRVQINKHFFSYHYDYRDEWLKFTAALSKPSDDVSISLISTMASLVGAPAGLLFAVRDGRFQCISNWHMPSINSEEGLGSLPAWVQRTGWVIDFYEWRNRPSLYEGLTPPEWIRSSEHVWLLVPLIFRDSVIGIVLLKRAELKDSLDWEDRDLLKTAGRQAASYLAQNLASEALVEARQFDAFNRLSAYVAHDLKNILAQQSLMIANANRHKENPAFVDDMISTVTNSVGRMQRLMEQMRSGVRETPSRTVLIKDVLAAIVTSRARLSPAPSIVTPDCDCTVTADPERLSTVFNHLIQNAQEATPPDGTVSIALDCDEQQVYVEITDTGRGMTEEFIRERLFRPFDSTKGLTGMGIGAFESREYVRHLGGELSVSSEERVGSTFVIKLPRASTCPADEQS